jgi:hypothetical protein
LFSALTSRLREPEPQLADAAGTHWWPDDLTDRPIEEALTAAQ